VKVAELQALQTKLEQEGQTEREKIKAKLKLTELKLADVARKETFQHEALEKEMNQNEEIQKFTMAEISKMIEKGVDVFDFNCYLEGMRRSLPNGKPNMDRKYLEDIARHKVCLATQTLPPPSSTTTSTQLEKQGEEIEDDDDDNFFAALLMQVHGPAQQNKF